MLILNKMILWNKLSTLAYFGNKRKKDFLDIVWIQVQFKKYSSLCWWRRKKSIF